MVKTKKFKEIQNQGFTFFELLCSVALISIFLMISLYFYSDFVQKHQRRAILENINQQIKVAKYLAFREKISIVLQANEGEWANGWVAFKDSNHNFIYDADEIKISHNVQIKKNTHQKLKTIVDTTHGCLAFDGKALIKRCGDLQNLVLNGRIILSNVAHQGKKNYMKSCANSSSLKILRHRSEMVCESYVYNKEAAQSNQNGFIGDCICEDSNF